MKEDTATFVGFLVAPIFPALLLGIGTPLTPEGPDLLTILGLFPIGYCFSAATTALLAVPLFLLGKRMNLVRWWSAVIVGFIIGAGVSIALQWPNWGIPFDAVTNIYGITGAISGLVFWLVWRQGQTA